jgi:MFS transporter, MHS family, shikimate and dehydroshikimate transport protein
MEALGGGHLARQHSSIRRVALASFLGTAIEWYDFYLYGTAAALVFPQLFFPRFNPVAGTLASFATFGVAFFARPVGGVVFGHFGDRIGRKATLVITLLLMGAATFLVGILPTFEQGGVLAPILLTLLRVLQGFAVGGEWGGATLMTVEHAPAESRNFYASWPQTGSPTGLILSTAVFSAFSSLPDKQFFSWGWRVPFLLSVVLIAVGLFIRLRIVESPAFSRIKELGFESKVPLADLLREYKTGLILAIGVVLGLYGHYIVITFAPSYIVRQLGLPRSVALIGLLLAGGAQTAGILIFAWVADRVGKRPVAIWSATCIFLLSYPFFWLADTRQPALIWLAMGAWAFAEGALYGITGVFIAELFPVQLRYSGISFGYQVAGVLGGGLAPIIATALTQWAGGASWPVATYLACIALIGLVAVCLASDKYRMEINDQGNTQLRLAGERR